MKPFIHLFRTSKGYYFYDVNTDSILKVSQKTYNLLGKEQISYEDMNDEMKELLKQNYLQDNKERITEHPLTNYIDVYLKNKISSIVLQVTQNCNLRCEYCVYSGGYYNRSHLNKNMSFDICKKAIDFLIEHSADEPHLNIGFYGGEPLLQFPLIQKCIDYAEQNIQNKILTFSMTTNATLLTKSMFQYFIKHNVTLTISFDGPKEAHDKYRKFANSIKGSHEIVINILKKLAEEFPDEIENHIIINVVGDQEASFKQINDFFNKYAFFRKLQITFSLINDEFAKEKKIVSDAFVQELQYEMFKIYLKMLGKLEEQDTSLLLKTNELMTGVIRKNKVDGTRSTLPRFSHHGGPCIPGNKSLFVDVEGKFLPCEKVPEDTELYVIGNVDDGFDYEKVREMMNLEKCMSIKCHNCWAYDYCTVCAASSNCRNRFCKEEMCVNCQRIRMEVEKNFKDYCLL